MGALGDWFIHCRRHSRSTGKRAQLTEPPRGSHRQGLPRAVAVSRRGADMGCDLGGQGTSSNKTKLNVLPTLCKLDTDFSAIFLMRSIRLLSSSKDLPEPIRGCEGSLVYHPGTNKTYFSHPDPVLDLFRNRLKVWSSGNLGATWQQHAVIWDKSAGYSSMAVMQDGKIGVFYDRNNHSMVVFEAQSVSFTTFAP